MTSKCMRLIVGQFIDRDIITESVLLKFKGAIAAAFRLRNSVVIEGVFDASDAGEKNGPA